MSVVDAILELSDAQAFTSTGDTASTDIIDLGAANVKPGDGTPLYLNVRVNTLLASAGSPTVVFTLQSDTSSSFASPTSLLITPAIAMATLVAGYWVLRIPLPYAITERFLRILYTVGVAVLTGGAFDAWIDLGKPQSDI